MKRISRRNMLATTGGLLTAAAVARAQTGELIPQPRRPGRGGTDPGPRGAALASQRRRMAVLHRG